MPGRWPYGSVTSSQRARAWRLRHGEYSKATTTPDLRACVDIHDIPKSADPAVERLKAGIDEFNTQSVAQWFPCKSESIYAVILDRGVPRWCVDVPGRIGRS